MAFLMALPLMGAATAATGMSGLGMLSTVMGIAGSGISAMGTIAAGKAQAAQANAAAEQQKFQAKQFKARGKWEQATKQREAFMIARRKRHAISRAEAVGANSGFMLGDHSSAIAISNLERWGSFDELAALSGGEMARQNNELQADSANYQAAIHGMEARSASSSASIGAMGTLIGGVGSAFGKFSAPTQTAQATTQGWSTTSSSGASSQLFPYG